MLDIEKDKLQFKNQDQSAKKPTKKRKTADSECKPVHF